MLVLVGNDPQPDAVDGLVRCGKIDGAFPDGQHQPDRLTLRRRQRNGVPLDPGMAQGGALNDIVLDVEIAPIHVHAGIPPPHIEARRVAGMVEEDAVLQ